MHYVWHLLLAVSISTKYVHDSVPSTVMCWCKALQTALSIVQLPSSVCEYNLDSQLYMPFKLTKGTDYESLYIIMLSSQIMDCSLV